MPVATDPQMQAFCNDRLRPFAQLARSVYLAAKDHKSAIDDVYARAISGTIWNDSRTDGPPHLLASGGSANPDDVENMNAFVTAFTSIIDGTDNANDAANAAALRSSWAVLLRACVHAVVPGQN